MSWANITNSINELNQNQKASQTNFDKFWNSEDE